MKEYAATTRGAGTLARIFLANYAPGCEGDSKKL